jgi:hypothetical protein
MSDDVPGEKYRAEHAAVRHDRRSYFAGFLLRHPCIGRREI